MCPCINYFKVGCIRNRFGRIFSQQSSQLNYSLRTHWMTNGREVQETRSGLSEVTIQWLFIAQARLVSHLLHFVHRPAKVSKINFGLGLVFLVATFTNTVQQVHRFVNERFHWQRVSMLHTHHHQAYKNSQTLFKDCRRKHEYKVETGYSFPKNPSFSKHLRVTF